MANVGEITVNVKPIITVDDNTAYIILGLLELYCKANKKTIEINHGRPADSDEEFSVYFNLVDDDFYKEVY